MGATVLLAVLMLFSLRRLLFVAAAWMPARSHRRPEHWPPVLVAMAFRNEADALPLALSSLAKLEYEPGRRRFCLVDDGSTDHSAAIGEDWARKRTDARLLRLACNRGKAAALNQVLAAAGEGNEILVVYDADQRPRPESLRRLVAPLADINVAAVAGYRRPVGGAGAVAAYAAAEAWTHQLVNLAAKDRLGWNPPTMGGNCAYRLAGLREMGGFPEGAFSEDIEVSLALSGTGRRTHFLRDAVADGAVAQTLRHFWKQRLRWNRGMAVARRRVTGIEAAFVAAGYLDRVVLAMVAIAAAAGWLSPWWLAVYFAPALAALVTALAKAQPSLGQALRVLAWLPVLFAADIGSSLWSAAANAGGQRIRWDDRRTEAGVKGGAAWRKSL